MEKRTTKQIGQEISAELQTIKLLEGKLERARGEHAEAQEAQRQLSYDAIGKDDEKASKALKVAEEKLIRSQTNLKSHEAALERSKKILSDLEEEYHRVEKDECFQHALELAESKAMPIIERVSERIKGLGKDGSELAELFEEIRRYVNNSGRERAFAKLGLSDIILFLEAELVQFEPFRINKPSELYRKMTLAELFRERVKHAKQVDATYRGCGAEAELTANGHDAAQEAEAEAGA